MKISGESARSECIMKSRWAVGRTPGYYVVDQVLYLEVEFVVVQ